MAKLPSLFPQQFWEKQRNDSASKATSLLVAQLLLHTAVNELHSIEIKADAISFFLLTQNLEGVKP